MFVLCKVPFSFFNASSAIPLVTEFIYINYHKDLLSILTKTMLKLFEVFKFIRRIYTPSVCINKLVKTCVYVFYSVKGLKIILLTSVIRITKLQKIIEFLNHQILTQQFTITFKSPIEI